MTRLRYNLVEATLVGDLDISDTSIVFAAALQEGGVDVPTLAGGDIIVLRIDDEIMHLTAYTAGATTGTVLRAQGNTVEADHITGATIKHVPTKEDFGVDHLEVNAQTGTTYTPVLTDDGKLVTQSNAGSITTTLPQDSSVAFPIGTQIHFAQIGAGQVTFAAGAGATVNGTPGLKCRAQWSAVSAIKRAANTWLLVGDLSA